MDRSGPSALPVPEGGDMAGIQARVLAGEEVTAEEYLQFVRYGVVTRLRGLAQASALECDFFRRYEAAGIADVMEMEQSAVSGKVPTVCVV